MDYVVLNINEDTDDLCCICRTHTNNKTLCNHFIHKNCLVTHLFYSNYCICPLCKQYIKIKKELSIYDIKNTYTTFDEYKKKIFLKKYKILLSLYRYNYSWIILFILYILVFLGIYYEKYAGFI